MLLQWLVKKALETREEFGDETRQLSLLEYRRHVAYPQQERLLSSLPTATKALASIQVYISIIILSPYSCRH